MGFSIKLACDLWREFNFLIFYVIGTEIESTSYMTGSGLFFNFDCCDNHSHI